MGNDVNGGEERPIGDSNTQMRLSNFPNFPLIQVCTFLISAFALLIHMC